jgi:hypothetical protein
MPEFCAHCGGRVGNDREDDDVVMPFIRTSAKTQVVDKVYRDMESGSEFRAQEAARMLSVPVSDMSALKITNMNDHQKPGDLAVPRVDNEVSRFMDAHPRISGFNSEAALAYSGQVMTGPQPNAGARMRTFLQNYHGETTHGTAVSDRPSNETYQPGYRRRG